MDPSQKNCPTFPKSYLLILRKKNMSIYIHLEKYPMPWGMTETPECRDGDSVWGSAGPSVLGAFCSSNFLYFIGSVT